MEYEKLRREVERVLGCRPMHPTDFALLVEKVRQRTGERVSPTTLMRIWRYVREDVTPRPMTLNVLARFAGYKDYDALLHSDGGVDSEPVMAAHLTDRQLATGQRVRLCWKPDRVMVACHKGRGAFVVEQAENSKLHVGDTFNCRLIVEHEPLYMTDVMHNGTLIPLYVAGHQGGVVFDVL